MNVNRAEGSTHVARSDLHNRLYEEIDALAGGTAWRSWVCTRLEEKSERWLRRRLFGAREIIDRLLKG